MKREFKMSNTLEIVDLRCLSDKKIEVQRKLDDLKKCFDIV